jgi:ribosomal protein L22
MSAEEEKGETAPEESEAAKQPAAKKAPAKKPAKAAAKGAEAKGTEAKETEAKAAEETAEKADASKKPAARKAAKEPAAKDAGAKEASAKEVDAKAPAAKKPAAKEPAAAKESSSASESEKAARGSSGKAPRRRVVRAHARYVRTSARKARMVCPHIRGKTIPEARAILAFTSREVARDWSKLLESAVANAENNHELLEEDLVVREAYADEGPTIKRFRPRAMGRATPIHKRTSHLTITLTPGS